VLQDFLPTEVDMNPKMLTEAEGYYSRVRHKMRQMRPGEVYASSKQGSEVFLDEGVLISNRRANEIRLRDQDQAIVLRSLQQFHAMGGARVYGGMVQRDASFLPRRMFTDGYEWNAPLQESATTVPKKLSELRNANQVTNALQPHDVFIRSEAQNPTTRISGLDVEDNQDPYAFLMRGLFITAQGLVPSGSVSVSDAEYNGKPIFRVSIDPDPERNAPPTNGILGQTDVESQTLTEYRIELDHTNDGRLPVTEQTDGFDADRLPSDAAQQTASAFGGPYIKWVLGSVVGNDAFSKKGKALYGQPLVPRVFPTPEFISGIGVSLDQHAASLFRVEPPLEDPSKTRPMFVSTTKNGDVRAALGGSQSNNSLEMSLNGGMLVGANGPTTFNSAVFRVRASSGTPESNYGIDLETENGAVRISGQGPSTQATGSQRTTSKDNQATHAPHVLVEAPRGNVHVQSARFTKISGANAVQLVDTNQVLIQSKQTVVLSTDSYSMQMNELKRTVQGKETTLYSGPKSFLPTNLPIRTVTFAATPLTGHFGGPTDKYTMVLGDREERFFFGSHRRTIIAGNNTTTVGLGNITQTAGLNSVNVGTVSGVDVTALTGPVNIFSTISASMTGLAKVSVKAVGEASLSALFTRLGGVGRVGGILCSTDREPFTGLPYAFFGSGSPGHQLSPPL
jgi:hypothetical protein